MKISTSSLSQQSNPSSTTSTSTSTSSLTHIPSIQSISSSYTTFLLDMWGVMHNGSTTYHGVIQTIKELKKQHKKLIIVSNSSKRLSNSIKMLTKLGFNVDVDFDGIITSGDLSYHMLLGDNNNNNNENTLKKDYDYWNVLKDIHDEHKKIKNVFVFGSGDGDEEYMTSSGWTLSSIENADLIVARGTFTINNGNPNDLVIKKDNEGHYFHVLEQSLMKAAKRKVPMLVTNPDKVRPDVGLPPMPGAIGDAYEKYLNNSEDVNRLIKRIGKPYPEVYDLALNVNRSGSNDRVDKSSVIMVGDALETDITGGKWANIDTLWVVNDGIHAPFVNENKNESFETNVQSILDDFNDKKGYEGKDRLHPTYVTKHFQW